MGRKRYGQHASQPPQQRQCSNVSIGNEVPTQCSADGYRVASFLQRDLSPRRSYTSGNLRHGSGDLCAGQWLCCFAGCSGVQLPGASLRRGLRQTASGSGAGLETSSTVSSRGVYKFPAEKKADALYDDHQSSSYDMEYCFFGLTCPTMIWPWPKIMTGRWDSSCGPVLITWESLLLTIPMPGSNHSSMFGIIGLGEYSERQVSTCTKASGIRISDFARVATLELGRP